MSEIQGAIFCWNWEGKVIGVVLPQLTSHHDRYLSALAEVFTLQLSSDCSLELLPFVNDGLFPLCRGQ